MCGVAAGALPEKRKPLQSDRSFLSSPQRDLLPQEKDLETVLTMAFLEIDKAFSSYAHLSADGKPVRACLRALRIGGERGKRRGRSSVVGMLLHVCLWGVFTEIILYKESFSMLLESELMSGSHFYVR